VNYFFNIAAGGAMLETLLNVWFLLILVMAGLVGAACFWQWFYSTATHQDETVFFLSRDGWRLALHHYRPQGQITGLPVVLCHGLSSNRYMFDLPQAPSLAEFLRSRGRDVWVAELRGSGMSECPGLRASDVPYSWHFEDHLLHDVPAMIDCVLERTSARAVHWVGHSMGGLLVLAHLARVARSPVASAVTIGAPVDFSQIQSSSFSLLQSLKWLIRPIPVFPLPFVGKIIAPIAHWIPNVLLGILHSPNIQPAAARRVLALASQTVTSTALWLDFGRFLDQGAFAPVQGEPYVNGLRNSTVPLFIIGGSKDVMAPPEAVRAACTNGRDPELQKLWIFGKASGCAEDYGHVDLLVGARAEGEVYPNILEWLEKQDAHYSARP
jgi:pimeloyl-ACP methyl ester carboxylesterase